MIDKTKNPEFLNSFLDYSSVILNKSPNTIKEYNYDLVNFLKFTKHHLGKTTEKDFSNINITDISIEDIKELKLNDLHSYLAYLKDYHNAKPATRARKAACLKTFFNYLTVKTNQLEINPAQNLESPKLDKRIPKYLSLDESKELLNTVHEEDNRNNERDYAIITIFLNCGIRLAELVNINISDINFSDNKLNVIGKGNKERTIYLNKACIRAIGEYLSIRNTINTKNDKLHSNKALFLSERKERISRRTVQHIVYTKLAAAGLDPSKYSAHKLRHTAATLMYQYGQVDIRALQVLLGHESISTTEIYTHVDNEQVRNAVESNPLSNI